MIGQKRCSIRVQTMEMNCDSGAMCLFSFSRLRFTQKLQRKCMSKLSVLFQKPDRQQLFKVRTLIDHQNDFKMFKTLQLIFNILTSLLWSIGVLVMENSCQLLITEYFTCPPTAQAATIA